MESPQFLMYRLGAQLVATSIVAATAAAENQDDDDQAAAIVSATAAAHVSKHLVFLLLRKIRALKWINSRKGCRDVDRRDIVRYVGNAERVHSGIFLRDLEKDL